MYNLIERICDTLFHSLFKVDYRVRPSRLNQSYDVNVRLCDAHSLFKVDYWVRLLRLNQSYHVNEWGYYNPHPSTSLYNESPALYICNCTVHSIIHRARPGWISDTL